MRSVLALGAAAAAALAAMVSLLDGDTMELAFFGLLTAAGVVMAAALGPWTPSRLAARVIAITWTTAGLWIGGLLVMYQGACGCSMPTPLPDDTYLGFTATAYHVVGMYLSNALVLVAAFGRSSFLDRPIGPIGRIEHLG